MDILTQAISIAALVFLVASYQQTKKTTLILCQLIGGGLFGIHYLLLGAYAGFLLNVISVFRGIVFYKGNFSPRTGRIWVGIIIGLCVVAYAMTFLVFGTEPTPANLILEFLPTVGMTAMTISFNMSQTRHIRALSTINSAGWLTYNIAHLSIGGIICESICCVSIIVGILRHDVKRKK